MMNQLASPEYHNAKMIENLLKLISLSQDRQAPTQERGKQRGSRSKMAATISAMTLIVSVNVHDLRTSFIYVLSLHACRRCFCH